MLMVGHRIRMQNVVVYRRRLTYTYRIILYFRTTDQGYGRGGTPIFTGVFEPLAQVALYPTDEDGLGTVTWFAAA